MPTLAELWRTAESHAAAQDWNAAQIACEAVLRVAPKHSGALLQMSYLASFRGEYRNARKLALQAKEAGPATAVEARDLATRLRGFNAATELDEFIQRLRPWRSQPPALLVTLAAQLSYLNLQERALELLEEASRHQAMLPTMLLARAQIKIYLGRFDSAERDLEECLRRVPGTAGAYWLLANLRRQTGTSNHVARLQELLAAGPRPADELQLAFALHKELDDLGHYQQAWIALERGCRVKRSTIVYDRAATSDLVARLIDMPCVAPDRALSTRTPIFIVGMHRSGTTLLEQLVDGHQDVKGIGELYDFTSQMRYATDHHCRGVIDATIIERARGIDWAAVGAGYLAGAEWRLGKERFFTDKLPSNFLNIGFICRALPQAKILHMVRDPVETCFSNLRELFSDANPYSYDQLELAAFFKQYRRLMAHWHQAFPGRILDVDYARLTRDTETVLREVCDFCGLDFQPRMLDMGKRTRGVATASAVQVRSKVEARERPKWAPYEEYLQPLIEALRE